MSDTVKVAMAVESNAHAIADHACKELLTKHADISARFGTDAQEVWTDHLQQRLLELAAALTAGDPAMFTARLAWSRSAMQARGLSAKDLDTSLGVLRDAVAAKLTESSNSPALAYIDQAMGSLHQGLPGKLAPVLDAGIATDRLALQYVQTIVAGNVLPGIALVVDAVEQGTSIHDAYLRVLLPAQKEVGRLWHLNELSVSEEHLVSYTTQRVMAILASKAQRKPDNGFTAIAGAVAGNVHDIGIRAIAYLLEIEGWRTIYLGSDIPQVELPNIIETFQADILLLSVALTSQLPATSRTISHIHEHCQHPAKIMVGGNGLAEGKELWKEIGADAYAPDADSAIALARELTTNN